MVLVEGRRESTEPVDQYIVQYCRDGEHKSSNKFPIQDVMDLTLKTILFCITQVVGSIGPHLATRAQVNYAVLCQDGILYNWCVALLEGMKVNLPNARRGDKDNFVMV